MSISPMPSEPTPKQLYLAHLDHIERVAKYACRKHRFRLEEAQDFVSKVHVKLLDDDYAIIRKFQGKSSFRTYLVVVINNLFKDHLDQMWGKKRPSAEAVRLGALAIRLEKLVQRDRFTLAEACEILVRNHGVDRQELEKIAERLHLRPPVRPPEAEDVEGLENHASPELPPDEWVKARERADRRLVVLGMLREILDQLPAEDKVLARLSTEHKISEISRDHGFEQKPLYRRLEKILKRLRQELESRCVCADEVRELLGGPEAGDAPS